MNLLYLAFRRGLPNVTQMVDHFQNTFPRAKAFQGGLALVGGICGVAQYFLDTGHPGAKMILGSGLLLIGLWPYTMAVIMPINNQLMAGDEPKKKGDAWIKGMVEKWASVHLVRTVAGGVAFGLCIKALLLN